jgi:hypothetical protein
MFRRVRVVESDGGDCGWSTTRPHVDVERTRRRTVQLQGSEKGRLVRIDMVKKRRLLPQAMGAEDVVNRITRIHGSACGIVDSEGYDAPWFWRLSPTGTRDPCGAPSVTVPAASRIRLSSSTSRWSLAPSTHDQHAAP